MAPGVAGQGATPTAPGAVFTPGSLGIGGNGGSSAVCAGSGGGGGGGAYGGGGAGNGGGGNDAGGGGGGGSSAFSTGTSTTAAGVDATGVPSVTFTYAGNGNPASPTNPAGNTRQRKCKKKKHRSASVAKKKCKKKKH
jgi:hypothetical protein